MEGALKCRVFSYHLIDPLPSLKVKIAKKDLCRALTANRNLVRVRLWIQLNAAKDPAPSHATLIEQPPPAQTLSAPFRITTWNCRGLKSGEPYLNSLATDASDIIVVTERWLWPYEEDKLSNVCSGFKAVCVCDKRLSDISDLSSGCGGVGILYKDGLDIMKIEGILSDRICGLKVHFPAPTNYTLTVIGTYMLCSDVENFKEHLQELERLICECQNSMQLQTHKTEPV